MMIWTIELESMIERGDQDLGDVADDLLAQLEQAPHLMGPMTYAQPDDRVVGAWFALAAPDVVHAADPAVTAFAEAWAACGQGASRIASINVREDAPASRGE